jgi:hypothetical protein
MSWGMVAVGAGTAVAGYLGSQSSKSASETQAEAAVEGAETSAEAQMQMFREGQAATAPWRAAGQEALGALGDIYGVRTPVTIDQETGAVTEWQDPSYERAMERFQTSPGYQFQLDEAAKASDLAASARGMSLSGQQIRRLQDISQGQAQMEFGKYTQGLQSLAGVGQSSAGQTAGLATGVGGNVGQTLGQGYSAAGAAEAQGIIGQSQAVSGALQQGAQLYGMYQGGYFDRPQSSGGYGGGWGGYGGGVQQQQNPYGLDYNQAVA